MPATSNNQRSCSMHMVSCYMSGCWQSVQCVSVHFACMPRSTCMPGDLLGKRSLWVLGCQAHGRPPAACNVQSACLTGNGVSAAQAADASRRIGGHPLALSASAQRGGSPAPSSLRPAEASAGPHARSTPSRPRSAAAAAAAASQDRGVRQWAQQPHNGFPLQPDDGWFDNVLRDAMQPLRAPDVCMDGGEPRCKITVRLGQRRCSMQKKCVYGPACNSAAG